MQTAIPTVTSQKKKSKKNTVLELPIGGTEYVCATHGAGTFHEYDYALFNSITTSDEYNEEYDFSDVKVYEVSTAEKNLIFEGHRISDKPQNPQVLKPQPYGSGFKPKHQAQKHRPVLQQHHIFGCNRHARLGSNEHLLHRHNKHRHKPKHQTHNTQVCKPDGRRKRFRVPRHLQNTGIRFRGRRRCVIRKS